MTLIIDAALVFLFFYHPTLGTFATAAVVIAIRHVPVLADEVARMADLESYPGMTAWLARVLLPGWRSPETLMSIVEDERQNNARVPVHVPVPSTAGSPDTAAILPNDDESMRDQFLNIMADQKDERGNYLFSSNQIHAAIGGHRATVLARVRDRRAATLPAQFRQDDGDIAPATYPVTKG
jgi:hypothetical protein